MRNIVSSGAAVFAVSLALVGCSSASSSSTISIDGQDLSGAFTVACAKQGGTVALTLADENNATYGKFSVGATLSADGKAVSAVTISGTKGGSGGGPYTLAYGQAGGMSSAGHADVTISGKKYTVKGEGTSATVDMSNMNSSMGSDNTMTQSFDIVFACDKVIQ